MGDGLPGGAMAWLGGLAGLVALALTWLAATARAVARLRRHYDSLAHGVAGGNLERLLSEHMRRLASIEDRLPELQRGLAGAEAALARSIRRVGLVKYDAFEHVGGQVSFALALLDDHGDGVMINSLYGREGSTIYCKAIAAGRGTVTLTTEEQQAVAEALAGR